MAMTEVEHGFIVGADVVVGNVEHLMLTTMLDTLPEDFGTLPDTAMGDAAYGTGANLEAMEQRGIELLSPAVKDDLPDKLAFREDLTQPVVEEDLPRLPINPQTKCFDKQAFVYEEATDSYYCPAGQQWPRECTEKVQRSGITIERVNYRCHAFADCSLATLCRKNPNARQGRRVTRDGYEAVRQIGKRARTAVNTINTPLARRMVRFLATEPGRTAIRVAVGCRIHGDSDVADGNRTPATQYPDHVSRTSEGGRGSWRSRPSAGCWKPADSTAVRRGRFPSVAKSLTIRRAGDFGGKSPGGDGACSSEGVPPHPNSRGTLMILPPSVSHSQNVRKPCPAPMCDLRANAKSRLAFPAQMGKMADAGRVANPLIAALPTKSSDDFMKSNPAVPGGAR